MSSKVAGVYSSKVTVSSSVDSKNRNITVILGKATTGPFEPTEVFSETHAEKLFGPELNNDFGLLALNKILKTSYSAIYCRIAHKGDKAVFKNDATPLFEAKEGGTHLNSATLRVDTTDSKVKVTLSLSDAVLEVIECSKEPLSSDYLIDTFNSKSMYLNIVATNIESFASITSISVEPGTDGVKEATLTSSDLGATTLYKGSYLNDARLTISTTVDGKIGATLVKNGVILESIPQGIAGETAEAFKIRFNNASEYVQILNYPKVKSVQGVFQGGDSGLNVDASDYIGTQSEGLKALADTSQNMITTLIIPGVSTPEVLAYAQSLANTRQDFSYIADPPLGLRSYQTTAWVDATGAFTGSTRLDSANVTVYSPWVLSTNNSGDSVYIPPSIAIASLLCSNDTTGNIWDAPAGYEQGLLTDVNGLEYNPVLDDRNILNKNSVVNPIIYVKDVGYVAFGNKTTKRTKYPQNPEADCSFNVVRLVNHIIYTIRYMAMSDLFKTNDSITWDNFKLKVEPFLRNIKENRGLYDYEVIMDETTVTSDKIDALEMPGIIRLKPSRTAEVIELNFELYPSGITFTSNEE